MSLLVGIPGREPTDEQVAQLRADLNELQLTAHELDGTAAARIAAIDTRLNSYEMTQQKLVQAMGGEVGIFVNSALIDINPEVLRGSLADGAPVASITETKARVPLAQATAANRPIYMASATPNGKAAISFNPANGQLLTSPAVSSPLDNMFAGQGSFILIAFYLNAAATSGAGAFSRIFSKGATAYSGSAMGVAGLSSGKPLISLVPDFATTDPSWQLEESLNLNEWNVLGIHYGTDDANNYVYSLNGGDFKTVTRNPLPSGPLKDDTGTPFSLGGWISGANLLNGRIGRFMRMAGKPSPEVAKGAVNWLRAELGLI